MTVCEMDKLGVNALEKELHNLQDQRDILNCTWGDSAKEGSEFKKVVADINLVKHNIEMFNLKELRCNVKGYVIETSYDSDLGFTIKIKSDNKIHVYKGIYTLDSVPSEQVNIGDRLGMIKEHLYYGVQDDKSVKNISIVINTSDDSISTDKLAENVTKAVESMWRKLN